MGQPEYFWDRVCEAFFVKNPDWFRIVSELPNKLDMAVCQRRTVSGEILQTTNIPARGWMLHHIVEKTNINPFHSTDFSSVLRWAYLQFSCQFFQMEGIYNYLCDNGMANPASWDDGTVTNFTEYAQAMTLYSAMIILCEEQRLPTNEAFLEPAVRDEVRKIVATLTSKTTDYGQAFLRHGVPGLLYRIWDKIARYATLSTELQEAKYESRRDTATDMLGYSVLIWSILEDMKSITMETPND